MGEPEVAGTGDVVGEAGDAGPTMESGVIGVIGVDGALDGVVEAKSLRNRFINGAVVILSSPAISAPRLPEEKPEASTPFDRVVE